MRQRVLISNKIRSYFADQGGVAGKTLALWGLAFKANTDDVREAPALDIIDALTAEGMRIRAFDPIAGENARQALRGNERVQVMDAQYDALADAEALAVVTDWNQFRNPDFARIKKLLRAPIIFDGRNLYSSSLIASQGFAYFAIGRPEIRP